MSTPLFHQHLVIEKQTTKGGWHYVVIEGIPAHHKKRMGGIRVKGWIDRFELKQFNLLPMTGGNMMLPLNSVVRKKIGKQLGDTVEVVLYPDDSEVEIPDDILACLAESEPALNFFLSLSGSNQKYYLDWIDSAKQIDTKAGRILTMMERLEKRKKFWDW